MKQGPPRPLGQAPRFVAPLDRGANLPRGMYQREVGYVRQGTYPFNITHENSQAWDFVMRRSMERESRKGPRRAAKPESDSSESEDQMFAY